MHHNATKSYENPPFYVGLDLDQLSRRPSECSEELIIGNIPLQHSAHNFPEGNVKGKHSKVTILDKSPGWRNAITPTEVPTSFPLPVHDIQSY